MITTKRSTYNPILTPAVTDLWQARATFNSSVYKDGDVYHMVYRAVSGTTLHKGVEMNVSTIGYAKSTDGIRYTGHRQLITPEHDWERYGCEDPRITKVGDKYLIFYTALSNYPHSAPGIKVGVAVTTDFASIEEKHPVTPFNAKAMALFPEKVNGKYVAILTAHTDMPPSKISLAFFDSIEDIWNPHYWEHWYAYLDAHTLTIPKLPTDQLEVGGAPVLTDAGWLLVYCHIQNYFSEKKLFRIDALLLDRDNPHHIISQTHDPILVPEEEYELYGDVPNVIFPSCARIENDVLFIYYGAADTRTALATVSLQELLSYMHPISEVEGYGGDTNFVTLKRFTHNPMMSPRSEYPWEAKYTCNPASITLGGKIHILYRAMGHDDTSVVGYASTTDGLHLDERAADPVYVPREHFERKFHPGNSGCEDPRLTVVGDTVYMMYTAYDGSNPPRVALTSIKRQDFLEKKWSWERPILISPPGMDDKDACMLPEKIKGKYVLFHRLNPSIWVDMVCDLKFGENTWLGGHIAVIPRLNMWDSEKVGLGGTPIKTKAGWLMIYHGLSKHDRKYRLGAILLDLHNPLKIVGRLNRPILEPEAWYENSGLRPGTVFACGNEILGDKILVYYGGADQYVAGASIPLADLLRALKRGH